MNEENEVIIKNNHEMNAECIKNFTSMKEQIKIISKKVDNMDDMKEVLVELKTLNTEQIKSNEKRDKILDEQNKLLIEVSNSIRDLSSKVNTTQNEVKEIKSKVSSHEEKDNISINAILKSGFFLAITVVITYLITNFLNGR